MLLFATSKQGQEAIISGHPNAAVAVGDMPAHWSTFEAEGFTYTTALGTSEDSPFRGDWWIQTFDDRDVADRIAQTIRLIRRIWDLRTPDQVRWCWASLDEMAPD